MMLNVCALTVASPLLQKQLPSVLSCSVSCSARLTILLHVDSVEVTPAVLMTVFATNLVLVWHLLIVWHVFALLFRFFFFFKSVNILFTLAQFTSALYWTFVMDSSSVLLVATL